MFRVLLSLGLTALLSGCSTLPPEVAKDPSQRVDSRAETPLGASLDNLAQLHPGMSGVLLLDQPPDALAARVQLARQARRSLDVQYYIWRSDAVGRQLMKEVVHAAQRGVRVRLLIDDLDGFGRGAKLALLNQHPAISVRLFNPFNVRNRYALFRRGVDTLVNVRRINRRMHNKSFTADNQAAVVGGRNIADEYFGLHDQHNLRDRDVLLAGAAVDELSASFDLYWNSDWAFPVDKLHATKSSAAELDAVIAELEASPEVHLPSGELVGNWQLLTWCPAQVVYDRPDKLAGSGDGSADAVLGFVAQAERELTIEAAYFVPGRAGVRALADLVARGVRVRVLTNSLAGNDSTMAHSGYARYRRRLLDAGVELFELRPDAAVRAHQVLRSSESKLGLHAKTILIDRDKVFIGTLNLDPRSMVLNTEVGVVLTCPEFAERLYPRLAADFAPDSAWQLGLNDGKLTWRAGAQEMRRHEPAALGRRLRAWFWSLLPLESQL